MNKRDMSITYIRVLAMFMILICHIANHTGIGSIAQLFQVGVQIFLLISGYLCAMHNPESALYWLVQRVKRVFVPIWLFYIFVILACFMTNSTIHINEVIIGAAGIYGITQIIPTITLPSIQGMQHLWFITPLFLSYIITSFIYHIKRNKNTKVNRLYAVGILVILQFLFAMIEVRIDFIIIFFIGYACYRLSDSQSKYAAIISNIVACIFMGLRVFCSLNESLSLSKGYLFFIIPICYNAMALAIFYDVRKMVQCVKINKLMSRLNRIFTHLDSISYEVYIVHYIFIEGVLGIYAMKQSLLINTMLFMLMSFAAAEILHVIVKHTNSIFNLRRKD